MIADSAANTDTTKSLRVGDHPVPSMGAEQVESIVLDRIPATALRRITTPPSLSRDCRPPDLHKRTSLMSSMTVAPRVYPNVAGPASLSFLAKHLVGVSCVAVLGVPGREVYYLYMASIVGKRQGNATYHYLVAD